MGAEIETNNSKYRDWAPLMMSYDRFPCFLVPFILKYVTLKLHEVFSMKGKIENSVVIHHNSTGRTSSAVSP